ncbi:MAG: nucleotide-binding protein [Christensenellales bacterium]
MKQLLILSGKGGTGKTTVASAFIKLAAADAYADCDVDAPNLHLVLRRDSEPCRTDFIGMPKAVINKEACIQCDLCVQNCRFDAIECSDGYKVNALACEGCGVCEAICPANAISMRPAIAGELMLYTDRAVFSTARLNMGSGNSGKLVTEVKKQLKNNAANASLEIIDGSPGIGCPVIASISGADMVLIVAEPSVSGISDMERIIQTTVKFGAKIAICINKYDTNQKNTDTIELFCLQHRIPLTGTIPYDPQALKANNNGLSIVDFDCVSGEAVSDVFEKTMNILMQQ